MVTARIWGSLPALVLAAVTAAACAPESTTTPLATPTPAPSPTPTSTLEATLIPTPMPTAFSATVYSTWESLPPLTIARQELSAVATEGRIYAIGGLPGSTAGGTAEVFDLTSKAWNPIEGPPVPIHHPGVASLNGLVYLFGGYVGGGFSPTDEAFVYDPSNNAWRPIANLPRRLEANTRV